LVFQGLANDAVYGMVTHSMAKEAPPLHAFLDYLATAAPSGARSRTVSEVIISQVLPEQAAPAELLAPQVEPGQPPSGGKCGEGI
jgi:hypothetical protein